MIAVRVHQYGTACGYPFNNTQMIIDFDKISESKGITDTDQDAGKVIFQEVTKSDTRNETGDTCTAKDGG